MDTRLLELMVCPVCKGPLTRPPGTDELQCPADHLAFPIRDGIPVMLEAQARSLDEAAGRAADTGPVDLGAR